MHKKPMQSIITALIVTLALSVYEPPPDIGGPRRSGGSGGRVHNLLF